MFLSFLCNTFSPIVYLDSDIAAYPVHSIKFGYRIFAYFVSPLVLLWLLSASTWISFNHIQDYVFTWGKFGCFSLLHCKLKIPSGFLMLWMRDLPKATSLRIRVTFGITSYHEKLLRRLKMLIFSSVSSSLLLDFRLVSFCADKEWYEKRALSIPLR